MKVCQQDTWHASRHCAVGFSSTSTERTVETNERVYTLPLYLPRYIQSVCRWQRLEASLPASAPVIVNTGRTILLLQQQWQVFKETAVYTRMFYTAKQKIFLPVPSGFRQKQQTLNQHDSWAHRGKADAVVLPALENFMIKKFLLVQLHAEDSAEDPSTLCRWRNTRHCQIQILPANAATPTPKRTL